MFELGRQQRRQQLLASVGQTVDRQTLKAPRMNQASVQQDAQVATDAALLALGDQAQIANAALPRFIENSQQGQAIRVAKGLRLATQAARLLEIEQPGLQPLSFPRLRPTQSWWLVSDD
jgi:hypothetical protein